MIERGLVIAGEIVPGTDWILRDRAHFFPAGQRGTRERAEVIAASVGHWTGGEAGAKRFDDDGPFVVNVMRNRRRPDGSLLNVGITFVIAACDENTLYADVWQTLDPGVCSAVHIGKGWLNARTIGTEVVSAGMPGRADARRRPRMKVPLVGRVREVLKFYPGQLRSWVRLNELLHGLNGRAGISIPRRVPAFGASRRFSMAEARRWAGAMEHLHAPGTTKMDAGGMLVDALADAGWARVNP
jgi:hypothetical protein